MSLGRNAMVMDPTNFLHILRHANVTKLVFGYKIFVEKQVVPRTSTF